MRYENEGRKFMVMFIVCVNASEAQQTSLPRSSNWEVEKGEVDSQIVWAQITGQLRF